MWVDGMRGKAGRTRHGASAIAAKLKLTSGNALFQDLERQGLASDSVASGSMCTSDTPSSTPVPAAELATIATRAKRPAWWWIIAVCSGQRGVSKGLAMVAVMRWLTRECSNRRVRCGAGRPAHSSARRLLSARASRHPSPLTRSPGAMKPRKDATNTMKTEAIACTGWGWGVGGRGWVGVDGGIAAAEGDQAERRAPRRRPAAGRYVEGACLHLHLHQGPHQGQVVAPLEARGAIIGSQHR
jgi:hypothetical protein